MQSSNLNAVLKEQANCDKVISYVPKKIGIKKVATQKEFQHLQEAKPTDFILSDIISQSIGLAEQQRIGMQEKIEHIVLERLKDVEEQAYKTSYELGFQEGKTESYKNFSKELKNQLEDFNQLLNSMAVLKEEMLKVNEAEVIQMVYHLSQTLALKTIQDTPEYIMLILKETVNNIQSDEHVDIKLSPKDHEFIMSHSALLKSHIEIPENIKFESVESIQPGGCRIETNYGEIDSQIEERFKRLWDGLQNRIPEVKEVFE